MPTIKIYSTPTCPFCIKAKEFFKENNLEYEDINVAGNHEAAREMIEKSGQMGVPVIDIGNNIIIGFDLPKIKKALGMEE
jgi:glutaredoxin 3